MIKKNSKKEFEYPLEIPNEIPRDVKNSKGKVHATDTAEGVVGDILEFEQDPMDIADMDINNME